MKSARSQNMIYQAAAVAPVLILAAMSLILASKAQAEPWFGSRFAQNCAGCHAPGRVNKAAPDRRCSLSCQGCHTNPNGGGLRSNYGKWTSDRWLRSFSNPLTQQRQKPPSPLGQQPYKEHVKFVERQHTDDLEKYFLDGPPLKTLTNDQADPAKYTREHTPEELTAATETAFRSMIPADDPYRLSRQQRWTVGGDVRGQWLSPQKPDGANRSWLMSADFGLDYRPLASNLHLVYESRFLGNPNGEVIDRQIETARTRSLYLLVDDLPYNSFVMSGYYMPLFGNDSPDHTKLSRRMVSATLTGNSRLSYALLYKASSAGVAPNVPYLNVHYIDKRIDASDPDNQTRGFAFNTGLRFVTLGASVNYSYWSTRDTTPTERDTRILLQSIYLGSTFGLDRLYVGFEGIVNEVERDQAFYRATVWTTELFLRLFRETYLTFEYAKANSDENLAPGEAQQSKIGWRWFIVPGLEWSSHYVIDDFRSNGQNRDKRRYLASQLHLFY